MNSIPQMFTGFDWFRPLPTKEFVDMPWGSVMGNYGVCGWVFLMENMCTKRSFWFKATMVAGAQHLAVCSEAEIQRPLELRNSKSTNNATRLWLETFREFLKGKDHPELVEKIPNENFG